MIFLYLSVLISCALGVLHTYIFYPLWVVKGARPRNAELGWKGSASPPPANGLFEKYEMPSLPAIYVLMAAHNEEAVLEQKLQTLAAQDYPGQLTILIGSDCSTDRTNAILQSWAERDGRFHPTLFTERQGKPGIINQLAEQASRMPGFNNQGSANPANPALPATPGPPATLATPATPATPAPPATLTPPSPTAILVLTDASVMLRPNTITELARPLLEDARLGVVDSTMLQVGAREEGIGYAEETYISREVDVKRAESRRWGAMIGPFGGCWALRADAFTPVPPNFLVDDFFLCMAAYEKGFRGVSSPEAVVEEGVGQSLQDEFRRKARISSGNWQNLVRFHRLWWPFWKNPLAFAFFSHKVLRWWTPFFLLIGGISWLLLLLSLGYENNYWPGVLFALLVNGAILLSVADFVLTFFDIHFRPARYTRYFLAMNAALLVGFYRYLTGIKSNVWQPSQRH